MRLLSVDALDCSKTVNEGVLKWTARINSDAASGGRRGVSGRWQA